MSIESFINKAEAYVINSTYNKLSIVFAFGCIVNIFLDIFYTIIWKFNTCREPSEIAIEKIIDKSKESATSNQDKVAVITGANCGIGLETAKAIGLAGYRTILACRSKRNGDNAVNELKKLTGQNNFEFMELDLSSFDSIKNFISQFKEKNIPLNLLVNNAGVMMCPYSTTKDGIELQFGTNYVGHFMLTMGLLDIIKKSAPARIVIVSSLASFLTQRLKYDRISEKEKYDRTENYAFSKLADATFACALARKLADVPDVTVNSLHPGCIATNLQRHVVTSISLLSKINNALFLPPPEGALTSIYLSLSPDVNGVSGKYFARCMSTGVHPVAADVKEQEKLWEYTEKLIKEKSS